MPSKLKSERNLCLVVAAHQAFIRHVEDAASRGAENGLLFESISNVYLPLLSALRELEADGGDGKVSLVFSPVLCELLSDPLVAEQYVGWLDRRILLGVREVERLSGEPALRAVAEAVLGKARRDREEFTESYGCNVVGEIARLAAKGRVELLATCATFAFLPHYADMEEVVSAQIEAGLSSHKRCFGSLPDGFFLPSLGYAPGIERQLRAYGMNYTVVDSRGLFFSPDGAERGIFAPVRGASVNPLAFFAADPEVPRDLDFLSGAGCFRSLSRDVGFELPSADLSDFIGEGGARIPSGYRYWSASGGPYDAAAASAAAKSAAATFVCSRAERLGRAAEEIGGTATMVCVLDAARLGGTWEEGAEFFREVVRLASSNGGIRLRGCSDVLCDADSEGAELQRMRIYPSAATEDGFAESLLDSSNSWMLRYARKMCSRMIDISERFPNDTGLKIRLLNLGARELLLSQDEEWARLAHEDSGMREYAEGFFRDCIRSFIVVYDSLGSNTVSTEWLTDLERRHTLFPWLNYRIFSPKK